MRTCYKSVVCEVERGEVRHFYIASVRIFALGEELIDRVQGVGLNSIIGSKDDELWDLGLWYKRKVSFWQAVYHPNAFGWYGVMVVWLTGCSPPGGLVLAQAQSGSWHLVGSHEYPKADGLVVGPSIAPSCANASSGRRAGTSAYTRITGPGWLVQRNGGAEQAGKETTSWAGEPRCAFERTWIRSKKQANDL